MNLRLIGDWRGVFWQTLAIQNWVCRCTQLDQFATICRGLAVPGRSHEVNVKRFFIAMRDDVEQLAVRKMRAQEGYRIFAIVFNLALIPLFNP